MNDKTTNLPGESNHPSTIDPTYVVLPCSPKDFRNFVSGLLGKPQEHRGLLEGIFRVTHLEISNVFHLVNQRIEKQNDATLMNFAITVHYSNGTSVTHNKVADFETYHPISDCYPGAVSLVFTYLIKFNGRDHPEKQEIEVHLSTDPDYSPGNRRRWFDCGAFDFRILHTERTWADDIAGLLRNHAGTILDKRSRLKTLLSRRADEIMRYWLMVVFLAMMVIWGYSAHTRFTPNVQISNSEMLRY